MLEQTKIELLCLEEEPDICEGCRFFGGNSCMIGNDVEESSGCGDFECWYPFAKNPYER